MWETATLFLNAPLPPENVLAPLLPRMKKSFILCADGGYLFAEKLPIQINAVIGDLDTVRDAKKVIAPPIQVIEEPSQEFTDFEKALLYLKKQGTKEILLIGLTGERTDHVLANMSVLSRFINDFEFIVFGQEAKIYFLQGSQEIKIHTTPGKQISLMPLPLAENIVTKGLKYSLNSETLQWGIREGSSNEAVQDWVSVKLGNGLLVIFENYL